MDLLAVYMIKLSNYTVATYIWPALYMYEIQRFKLFYNAFANSKYKKTSLQTAITSTERREIKCVRKKQHNSK